MQDTLPEAILLFVVENAKMEHLECGLDEYSKHLLITSNIEVFLDILGRRLEEFKSVSIASEEHTASYTSTSSDFI